MATAKKSSTKKKKKHHSRGIHGLSVKNATNMIEPLALGVGGAILERALTKHLLSKFITDERLQSGAGIATGAVLIMMDKKKGMMSHIGMGFMVAGGLDLAHAFIPGLTGITEGDISAIEEEITVGDAMIEDGEVGAMISVGGHDDIMEGNGEVIY